MLCEKKMQCVSKSCFTCNIKSEIKESKNPKILKLLTCLDLESSLIYLIYFCIKVKRSLLHGGNFPLIFEVWNLANFVFFTLILFSAFLKILLLFLRIPENHEKNVNISNGTIRRLYLSVLKILILPFFKNRLNVASLLHFLLGSETSSL